MRSQNTEVYLNKVWKGGKKFSRNVDILMFLGVIWRRCQLAEVTHGVSYE
jgi:hypothetical protein